MTGPMTDFESMKVGDRVRFTVEGEVTYRRGNGWWFDVGGHSYDNRAGAVEILQQRQPVVGDIVTEANAGSLEDCKFALTDREGDVWSTVPGPSARATYGPFTLVYIHKD